MDLSQKPVDIRIGKKGISEALINEIKIRLKKKKLVKIKFLAAFLNSIEENKKKVIKEALQIIANHTDSEVLEVRGNTAILKEKLKTKK
ncbi:MAG: RNA-binding protein [Candidatus Woesearchaeota archaeon]|nr:RNA-binding protein [Candidatus Woesearchaeota archaeon]MDN5328207.1 RNA-binding protein [Candidatus Woesearchaeota archaeon]